MPKRAGSTPRYLLKLQTEVDAMQQLGPSLDAVYLKVGAPAARAAPTAPAPRSLSAKLGQGLTCSRATVSPSHCHAAVTVLSLCPARRLRHGAVHSTRPSIRVRGCQAQGVTSACRTCMSTTRIFTWRWSCARAAASFGDLCRAQIGPKCNLNLNLDLRARAGRV